MSDYDKNGCTDTTDEMFERFRDSVFKAWKACDMGGWELYVTRESRDSLEKETVAQARVNALTRRCHIVLSDRLHRNDIEKLEDLAVHEVAHCVLGPLSQLAVSRFVTEDELEAAEHEVVMRLKPMIALHPEYTTRAWYEVGVGGRGET